MHCLCLSYYRYRERLRTKYIKSLKPTDTCKSLSGKTWTFLKDGLDDFRDGLPPPLDNGFLIEVCTLSHVCVYMGVCALGFALHFNFTLNTVDLYSIILFFASSFSVMNMVYICLTLCKFTCRNTCTTKNKLFNSSRY